MIDSSLIRTVNVQTDEMRVSVYRFRLTMIVENDIVDRFISQIGHLPGSFFFHFPSSKDYFIISSKSLGPHSTRIIF